MSVLSIAALTLAILPSRAIAAPFPIAWALEEVGKRVELFWQQFPRVACTETVTQFKLDTKGKIVLQNKSVNDYLIMFGLDGDQLTVDESRTLKNKADKAPAGPLLVSKGFSTLLLIFHPQFQPSFEFVSLADERVEGKLLHRIAFNHIPGSPTPTVLQLGETNYPIESKGIAWVDLNSWSIVKMQTGLKTSLESVGLKALQSEVLYRPVRSEDTGETYWLPDTATVEARTLRQHWRNVHRFTDYRRFSVDIKLKVEMPE